MNCMEIAKEREKKWAEEHPNATEEEISKANKDIAEQVVKEVMRKMWKK